MKICDVYVCGESKSPHFRFIGIFDKSFAYSADRLYSGFVNVNIERIKMIPIISELRKAGVSCFSVPIEYRDSPSIDIGEARALARGYAESMGCSISEAAPRLGEAPLFWVFEMFGGQDERVGGVVIVDRLDGHIWGTSEYEEYMYDYNNVF